MPQSFPAGLRIALLSAALLGSSLAPAALAPEQGRPFLRQWSPKDLAGHPQNRVVVQDHRGLVYVANGLGVLEFDGVRWRLIETARRSTVRSLAVDAAGTVYVGAEGEIGRLRPDRAGQLVWESLEPLMDQADTEVTFVRAVHVLPGGILFQSREALLYFSQGRVRTVLAGADLQRSFKLLDSVLVQMGDGSLRRFKDGQLGPAPFALPDPRHALAFIQPLGPGHVLVGTRDHGCFRYDGARLTPMWPEASGLLKNGRIYSGVRLKDGNYAIGSELWGLAVLDAHGRLRVKLDRSRGLREDRVLDLCQDGQGGLWIALSNGLARAELPSCLSFFNEATGLDSFPWSLARHRDAIYAGTGKGLMVLDRSGALPRFRLVPGGEGLVMGVAAHGPDLLVANPTRGLYRVGADGRAVLAVPVQDPVCVLSSRWDPDLAYVGGQEGVVRVRRKGTAYRHAGVIPESPKNTFQLVETAPGVVWACTRSKGLVRLRSTPNDRFLDAQAFGVAQGLPSEDFVFLAEAGGRLLAGTRQGLYAFDPDRQRFEPERAFQALWPEGPRALEWPRQGTDGRVFMQATDTLQRGREIGAAIPDGAGGWRWQGVPFRRFWDQEVSDILAEPDGTVWFATTEGMVRYEGAAWGGPSPLPPTHLSRVLASQGRVIHGGAPVPDGAAELAFGDRAPRFEFAQPGGGFGTRYQVWLEGYDQDWSPWFAETFKEYTNLPPGSYRFKVRAQDQNGMVADPAVYAFRVQAPWYRTWWAILGFLAAGMAAVTKATQLRTRILERSNRDLQTRVEAATQELRRSKEEVEHQAEQLGQANLRLRSLNDQLSDINEQKNHFFGVVSHDLRNPLNGIVLNAELLESETDLSAAQEIAHNIRVQGKRMDELLRRFLDIAAIEAGTLRAEPEPVPLATLAAHALAGHEPRAQRKGITLVLEAPPVESLAFADVHFTREILENLLSNAVKFSPPGTTVTVRIRESAGGLALEVQDQGPGFTEEDRRRLFARFSRLSAKPTGGEASTGLGLSIVKHMADAMGCPLELESQAGAGALFRLRVPRLSGT